jgi:DNA-binding NarL/FixJ family response regulator
MTPDRSSGTNESGDDASAGPVARVLIADDDLVVRTRLKLLLTSDPAFEVVAAAADTDEAITMATAHQPDAALVDVNMPGGGGIRAVREIGLCSPNTAVVVLSALDEHGLVVDLLQAGAMTYIVKGASAEEISHALTRSIAARTPPPDAPAG